MQNSWWFPVLYLRQLNLDSSYYHFFWSQLIPAAYALLSSRSDSSLSTTTVALASSGRAHLDLQVDTVLRFLGASEVAFLPEPPQESVTLCLPRWDNLLYQANKLHHRTGLGSLRISKTPTALVRRTQPNIAESNESAGAFSSPFEQSRWRLVRVVGMAMEACRVLRALPGFHGACALLRHHMRTQIESAGHDSSPWRGRVLVVDRSPPIGKRMEGARKRAFADTADAAQRLDTAGVPAVRYEPGAHGILEQITAFAACKGVLAMRGAELSHLIWMRTGGRVLVGDPMTGSSPLRFLSLAHGIEFASFHCQSFDRYANHMSAIDRFFKS